MHTEGSGMRAHEGYVKGSGSEVTGFSLGRSVKGNAVPQ